MNASESVQDSVLFELSPPLPKNGKRGIGAFLQDILTDVPIDLRSRQQARALLLCAINSQLASRVLTDTKTGVLPLQPVRFRRTLLPHPAAYSAPSAHLGSSGITADSAITADSGIPGVVA